jgi:hypothetical protein
MHLHLVGELRPFFKLANKALKSKHMFLSASAVAHVPCSSRGTAGKVCVAEGLVLYRIPAGSQSSIVRDPWITRSVQTSVQNGDAVEERKPVPPQHTFLSCSSA